MIGSQEAKLPETWLDAVNRLSAEWGTGEALPAPPPSEVPLSNIHTETGAFQYRDWDMKSPQSTQHVEDMIVNLQQNPEGGLDPLHLWWSGSRFILIDGHHRLEAYRRVARKSGRTLSEYHVPVRVSAAISALEASDLALQGNVHNKLPLGKSAKLDAGWRLISSGIRKTRAEVMLLTEISKGTFDNMRAALKQLQSEDTPPTLSEMSGMTWDEARRRAKGEVCVDYDNTWEERMAEDWCKRLWRLFGGKMISQPELLARALSRVSPALPSSLMQSYAWSDVAPDIVSALSIDDGRTEEQEEEEDF